ncbi:MAG: replicative DNA helicase [Firmicutes bacterium]|nr:replicative DNA helicase [Bacillota bacterium]
MATASAKKQDSKLKNHPNVAGQKLPRNTEAEQALLGSILLDENAGLRVLDGLTEEDFFSPANKAVYQAMHTLAAYDKPIDMVSLSGQLDMDGTKAMVGGLDYLSKLTDIVPSSDNYGYYREIVKKQSLLRQLLKSAGKISDTCYAGDPEDHALQLAEQEVYNLAQKQDRSAFVPIGAASVDAITQMEKIHADPLALRGIETPFKGINKTLGGLQRSDLILIAARPGQGKTSIGMNLISHAALTSKKKTAMGTEPYSCAVFSLEMPAMQLAKRMLCSVSGVDMQKANGGQMNEREWRDIQYARERLQKAKIYVDDNSLTTPVEILSKCRRLKREHGLDLVMIDYLQLMTSGKRVESRQQEISDITRTLKIAAKELDVPILLLSQMSREIEKRVDKRPQMSDLRESGAIEQDADIIVFIYRKHDAHDMTVEEGERNKVELHIAKHRNGETGVVDVRWEGKTTTFRDIDFSAARYEPRVADAGGSTGYVQASKAPAKNATITKKQATALREVASVLDEDVPLPIPPQEELYSAEELAELNKIREKENW